MSSSRVSPRWILRAIPLVALISMFATTQSASAQAMPQGDPLAADAFSDQRLGVSRDSDRIEDSAVPVAAEVENAWSAFRTAAKAEKPGE